MHRSAPDSQADPPGALNLDSSSALETTQIVLLSMQRVHLYYRSPPPPSPLRYLVHGRRRRCIHLFFFTMQTLMLRLVLHAFVIPPAAHTRERAAIFMVQCNERSSWLRNARNGPPLFLFPGLPLSKLHYLGCGSGASGAAMRNSVTYLSF